VALEDALELVLLYGRVGDRRFERAALRWHARLCAELPELDLAGAATALQALAAIGRGNLAQGAGALAGVLEEADAGRLAAALKRCSHEPRRLGTRPARHLLGRSWGPR